MRDAQTNAACAHNNVLKAQTCRRQARYELMEAMFVCAPGVLEDRLPAITVDVSYDGMSVIVPASIPVGTAVLLQWTDRYLVGHIRHSRADGTEFRAGIKLERLRANTRSVKSLLQKAAAQCSATVA